MNETKQLLLQEWNEIRESLRYFGNKRFAQLTVFIASTGFLIDAFSKQPVFAYRIFFSVLGAILGILFLTMELRSVRYWNMFADRGEEIEQMLGDIELMSRHRPKEGLFSATSATYVFYVCVILSWIMAVFIVLQNRQVDPSSIIAKALAQAPILANDTKTEWELFSLSFDEKSGNYNLTLRESHSPKFMDVSVNGKSGRILNVVKRQPATRN